MAHTYFLGYLLPLVFLLTVYIQPSLQTSMSITNVKPSLFLQERTTYYVDATACPAEGSGSLEDPYCSIQWAINFARPNDTIVISDGIYVENIFINKSLTLQGEGVGQTIVDGNLSGQVFWIQRGLQVSMSSMTITNGLTDMDGGGVFNEGVLTLENVEVISNTSSTIASAGGGGGIANEGSLTLMNSTIANNYTLAVGGGLVSRSQTALTVVNVTIKNNQANVFGGGVVVQGRMSMKDSFVIDNHSISKGGGLVNMGYIHNLENTTIANNTATTSHPDCFTYPEDPDVVSGGYNIIGDGEGCKIAALDSDQIGTSQTPIFLTNNESQKNKAATLEDHTSSDTERLVINTDTHKNPSITIVEESNNQFVNVLLVIIGMIVGGTIWWHSTKHSM